MEVGERSGWCISLVGLCSVVLFFFFNDTATTEIYTLSLHDALPIYSQIVSSLLEYHQGLLYQ